MKYPIFDRLQLLKIGYAKGVSLSWLSQQNNFFAMNLLELIDQQIIQSTCEKYFDEAYSVWEQQVALNNKKIAKFVLTILTQSFHAYQVHALP